MIRLALGLAAPLTAFSLMASPAAAQMMTTPANEATPPVALATVQAQPYLYAAGQSDLFEITSALVALQRSQTPDVRDFAQRMILDHTKTTNAALAAAKAAGVTAPPPVLDEVNRQMVTALLSAPAAEFDRTYLSQQVPSHRAALEVVTGYSRSGDTPALRAVAATAVPIVAGHLRMAEAMRARML